MSHRQLPQPATQQDEYGYAIVLELRRLNRNIETLANLLLVSTAMPEPDAPQNDETKLREPAKKRAHRDTKKAKSNDAADSTQ